MRFLSQESAFVENFDSPTLNATRWIPSSLNGLFHCKCPRNGYRGFACALTQAPYHYATAGDKGTAHFVSARCRCKLLHDHREARRKLQARAALQAAQACAPPAPNAHAAARGAQCTMATAANFLTNQSLPFYPTGNVTGAILTLTQASEPCIHAMQSPCERP